MTPAKESTKEVLHVFVDGHDWVIAASAEDAMRVAVEYLGAEADVGQVWSQLPDDQPLTVWTDGPPPPDATCCLTWAVENVLERSPNGHRRGCPVGCPRKAAGEWATEGRQLLASTEW